MFFCCLYYQTWREKSRGSDEGNFHSQYGKISLNFFFFYMWVYFSVGEKNKIKNNFLPVEKKRKKKKRKSEKETERNRHVCQWTVNNEYKHCQYKIINIFSVC